MLVRHDPVEDGSRQNGVPVVVRVARVAAFAGGAEQRARRRHLRRRRHRPGGLAPAPPPLDEMCPAASLEVRACRRGRLRGVGLEGETGAMAQLAARVRGLVPGEVLVLDLQ